MGTFVEHFKTVLFRPEDLEIVLGSPSKRREYLNAVLVQTDKEYYRSLLAYKKGVKQRNKILIRIREGATSKEQLYFWDKLLVKNGTVITAKRRQLIEFISSCQTKKDLCINLRYDHSVISEKRLAQYEQATIAAGTTWVGPHRDDFTIMTGSKNLAFFGSRGEQRLAVLSLKLSELTYINQTTGEKPVLLLDDIFSELDEEHRSLVFEAMEDHQTVVTTTETDWLPAKFLDKMEVIKIK